jgi:adenylate cyclase
MLADIAGFSSLMERDESATFERVRSLREVLVAPKVAEYGGRVIKTTGDGFLAEFPSATAALRCGIEIQRQNHSDELSQAERDRIHMRIGINVGDIIIDGDDVAGDGVVIAARLEPLAPLDGICVSSTVREHIRQELGVEYTDLGDQQVKNISRPIRAYQIHLIGKHGLDVKRVKRSKRQIPRRALVGVATVAVLSATLLGLYQARPLWQPTSISDHAGMDRRMAFAVLPISAADGDKATAAFASQVTEGIVTRQTISPWARVVSRESTEEALRGHPGIKELGRALNVHFIIRGTVVRRGENFNTTLSLIDAESDRVLATQELKWPSNKPFNPKNTIFRVDVVGSLEGEAYGVERQRSKNKRPEDLDALDLVYLASGEWKGDESSYKAVMSLLQRALSLSPDDPRALRVMAYVNLDASRTKWAKNPKEQEEIGANAVDRFLRAVSKNNDPRMLFWKMYLYRIHGRFEDALAISDRLLEDDPEDSEQLREKAYNLLKLGRAAEALPLITLVLRQDQQPVNRMVAAAIQYRLGHYSDAADLAQRAAAEMERETLASPRIAGILLIRAAAENRLGHADRAKEALADFWALAPNVKTISSIRQWQDSRAELAEYQPLYDDLRRAGVPD